MWILYRQVIFCLFAIITVAALCPDETGWSKSGNNCLELSKAKQDWKKANAECKANSGRLISISSEEEQQNMIKFIKTEKPSKNVGEYWIGAHIPALVFPSYFDQCIDGYDYRDQTCFQILPELLHWKNAREACEERGGKLAYMKDEDTNVFVAEAMLEMIDKHGVKRGRDDEISYWIDGHSDGTTLEYYDSDERPLAYTNFMSSAVQNGPSCLVVFPKSSGSIKDAPNAKKTNITDVKDESGYEDEDDLSVLGIPDDIAQTTVVSYSASTYTTYETNTAVPEFNIVKCDELRLSVCEFALTKTKNENQTETVNPKESDKSKHPDKTPSYVSSCSELVGLVYQSKVKAAEKKKLKNGLIEDFSTLERGNYILKSEDTSTGNNITQYKLQYCSLNSENYTSDGKELFKWASNKTSEPKTKFTEYNILNKDYFDGACVYAEDVDEVWFTSECTEKRRYVCEYPEKEANERFCKISETKTDQCDVEDDLKQLNENSGMLLKTLQSSTVMADQAAHLSVLSSLWEMTSQAQESLTGANDPQTTEESVNNFTSNIVNAASILLDTGAPTKANQDSVIGLVNSLGEYAADSIALLKIKNGKTQNVTKLSVTSPEIKLQIYVVGNSTNEIQNDDLDLFSNYNPGKRENIKMELTSEAKTLSEQFGVSFINAQYTNIHQMMSISKSSELMSDNVIAGLLNSEVLNNLNPTTYGESPSGGATSIADAKGTTYMTMATDIITATLRINGSSYSTDVRFSLERKNSNQSVVPGSETCAFLSGDDSDQNAELTWSSKGCHLIKSFNNRFVCKCNHTTDFAVLLMVFEPLEDILEGHRIYLFVLTIIGHFSTIICLFISILIFFLLKRNIKSDRRVIHINLFLSLMLAHTIMVTSALINTNDNLGIVDDVTETSLDIKCIVFTYFAHLLLLSAMFWMLVEGIVIYRKIVVVLSRQSSAFTNHYYFIGWGIPFVIATICICTGSLTDRNYNSSGCWLSIESGMVWAFAAPAIFVIVVNTGIIFKVLKVAMRTQKRKVARLSEVDETERSKLTRKAYIKTAVRGLLVLTPLLGLTWMCGLVLFHFSVAYIFVILNAFQGVSIFICYCVCNPEVRTALDTKWKHYKARKFSTISDDKINKKPKQSSKSRLLMRLSFSTSLQTRHGKFSSMENSSTINEKCEEKNPDEFIHDITPVSSPASGRSHYMGRLSSASTRSTCLSQQATSLTSMRSGSSSFFSQSQLRKMSSRVRPLSSGAEIFEENRVESTRPFSADAVMSRQAFVFAVDPPIESENLKNNQKTYFTERELIGNKEKESQTHTSSLENEKAHKKTIQSHQQTIHKNLGMIVPEEKTFHLDKSTTEDTEYPTIDNAKNEDVASHDLCCRQYYNVFGAGNLITVDSSKAKKKIVRPKSKLRRKTVAETTPQHTIRNNSIGKRSSSARVSINVTRKKKTISRRHSSKLDVLHSHIKTIKSKKQTRMSRPDSGDSRDSGISPDDV